MSALVIKEMSTAYLWPYEIVWLRVDKNFLRVPQPSFCIEKPNLSLMFCPKSENVLYLYLLNVAVTYAHTPLRVVSRLP